MPSPWDELIKQLTNPWDWVAAGVGAGSGAVVTVLAHGTDMGSSIGAGALTAVTARKAAAASMQGRQLKERADGLRSQITKNIVQFPPLAGLSAELEREQRLWESRAVTNEQFAKKLDALVVKYRRAFN